MIKKILGYSSMEQLEKSMTKRDKKIRNIERKPMKKRNYLKENLWV